MLLLLVTVVCVVSVPPVDDPDTAIDESDFQVNLAIPANLSVKLVHPIANSIDSPEIVLCRQDLRVKSSRREFMPVPKQPAAHSNSFQKLLCTFLI